MKTQKPDNLRDLGGLINEEGKRIRSRRILRSGELSGLSKEEQRRLVEEYELAAIIDLREGEEISQSPDVILDGVAYHNLDLTGQLKDAPTSDQRTLEAMEDPEYVDTFMQEFYASLISTPEVSKKLRKMVEIYLNQEEGAVLVHCFAGKDRTGISVAIILTLLGISKQEIFRDYMRTNEMRYEANRKMIEEFTHKYGIKADSPRAHSVLKAMSVDCSYLEAAYQAAEEIYGSFAEYIYRGIGVSREEEQRLRELYLV